MELSQAQAKLNECMEQLALKSKDLVNTKSDVVSLQQQHTQFEQQVILIADLLYKNHTLRKYIILSKGASLPPFISSKRPISKSATIQPRS